MQFAPLYPLVYRILQPTFPDCLWALPESQAITSESPPRKKVALTFDDGPHPDYTPRLLSVLDQYQVCASFFWLGVCVQRAPAIARQLYEQGHAIGLHGYDHRIFPKLSLPDLRLSLETTQAIIAAACHLEMSWVRSHLIDVRPPNGVFTPGTLRALKQWGYRPVMWSVVPEDWVHPGVTVVVDRILKQVKPGSVIVLHDGFYGGRDVSSTVAELIPQLQQQGYEFMTIPNFWP